MSHDDFDFEPMPGLPAMLPQGENLLWQGSPDWRSMAIRVYHVRKVMAYFVLLMLWRVLSGLQSGHSASAILLSCLFLSLLGGVAAGTLTLLAYLAARSTVYSITSRRILVRHGVAVPMTLNVPFNLVDGAALKSFQNGSGDISLALTNRERVGYLITWPHVRPGKFSHPEPSFRCMRAAGTVADILGTALAAPTRSAGSRAAVPQTAAAA